MHRSPLITALELAAQLRAGPAAPLLLDVRWSLGSGDGYISYLQGHLPGAVFVDMEHDLCGLPQEDGHGGRHPMPTVDDFELDMAECGVDYHRAVVCYDDFGSLAAARCWWLLRHFGKYNVQVLDGGLRQWKARRLPVESGARHIEEGDFEVRRGHINVLKADQALLYAQQGLLLDGRPRDRFHGENEIVDDVPGHIPGAVNVPVQELLNPDGTFLAREELRRVLIEAGVDGERPVATYCGSGIAAAHLALAIDAAGLGDDVPVYVGSWSDWTSDRTRPVAVNTHAAAEAVG
jgi:thiosulfate/3-mercaptopyruvate sulfurtransferase